MHFVAKVPFQDNLKLFEELQSELQSVLSDEREHLSHNEIQAKMEILSKWLSSTPQNTVFRINTLLIDIESAINVLRKSLSQKYSRIPEILTFSKIPEMILIKSWDESVQLDTIKYANEVIIDEACGVAVLRGAHVFAPGIIGFPHGLNVNDIVSIYSSSTHHCKKGFINVKAISNKVFIGNGILRMTREQIFGHNVIPSGIAIEVMSVISRVPQIDDRILTNGHLLLQNLPSIVCSRILNPNQNEIILDMCAAPGNKTTHIAQLMSNKGLLVAIEKNRNRMEKLKKKCDEFGLKNVSVFCADSRTLVCNSDGKSVLNEPPFPKESFDRILLDGPCSALGKRPQIRNNMNVNELRSFPRLQSHLFDVAVQLLKPGGILVYSTCTITLAENEEIVAKMLNKYSNLNLESVPEMLDELKISNFASTGHNIKGLNNEQSSKLTRFYLSNECVGFFIARFRKNS